MSGRLTLLLVSVYGRVLLLIGENNGVCGREPDVVRTVTVVHCFEMYTRRHVIVAAQKQLPVYVRDDFLPLRAGVPVRKLSH
jgi:hypothetical protein